MQNELFFLQFTQHGAVCKARIIKRANFNLRSHNSVTSDWTGLYVDRH